MKSKLETLQREMEQIKQSEDVEAVQQFFIRHPMLLMLGHIYFGGVWVLRACLWTLAFLLGVVGLKILWLAVLYMWRLV